MRTLLAGTLLTALPALAQVGYQAMLPPSPSLANPLAMLAPAPPTPFGLGAPLGMGSPLPVGLMHPGLQMAPNLLSHQHLQYMANPYLGGPAAGNPYLQPALPNPFAPPGFAPALPFAGHSQPAMALPFQPPGPVLSSAMPNPFLPRGPGQVSAPPPATTPAQGIPLPFDPASWFGQFAKPPAR